MVSEDLEIYLGNDYRCIQEAMHCKRKDRKMGNEIVFEIKKHLGVINEYPTGWKKEVNIISWNEGPCKVDIRDWDSDHLHMSKGITLCLDEVEGLLNILDIAVNQERIDNLVE